MFEQFAAPTRAVVVAAQEEAREQGARTIGTEHLLLGLLHADTRGLDQALGVDEATCREAMTRMDAEALAAVGVNATDFGKLIRPPVSGHLPLTAGSKAVLAQTLREARSARKRSMQPEHLLLALVSRPRPDPVAELLTRLAVDPCAVRRRLAPAA